MRTSRAGTTRNGKRDASSSRDVWKVTPRKVEKRYKEFAYRLLGRPRLLSLPVPREVPFFATLLLRRTRREFGPLTEEQLSTLLWFTSRTLATTCNPLDGAQRSSSPRWEHRVTPSAGGRHPVDVIVMQRSDQRRATLALYDPLMHALVPLVIRERSALTKLEREVSGIVSPGRGLVLWHATQAMRTHSRYENGESLVWRDVGCLVAMTAIVAEAMCLACCPLGFTGHPQLERALGGDGRLGSAGGCVIGGRVEEATQANLGER